MAQLVPSRCSQQTEAIVNNLYMRVINVTVENETQKKIAKFGTRCWSASYWLTDDCSLEAPWTIQCLSSWARIKWQFNVVISVNHCSYSCCIAATHWRARWPKAAITVAYTRI